MVSGIRIAVLMTCHNRRDTTLSSLTALTENTLQDGVSIYVILVDDGSTDGTADAITQLFPFVKILEADGNLYWNRGMHKAFSYASEIGFDFYLWLNDDTHLYQDAINNMLKAYKTVYAIEKCNSIIVGTTQDAKTGVLTYGGLESKSRMRPFQFTHVVPRSVPVDCKTMNGNCVLLPKMIANAVGNLDPRYVHALGDIDYGLRARKLGFKIKVAPGYIGTCDRNGTTGTFKDQALPIFSRLKRILGPKGLPPGPFLVFTRKHGGVLWLMRWVWPYMALVFSVIRPRRR